MSEEHNPSDPIFDSIPAGPAVNGKQPSLLTAYALGELDENQRARIAERLQQSADERQVADEIGRLGKLLRATAAEARLPVASSTLRESLLTQLAQPPQIDNRLLLPERFSHPRFLLRLSLAAALLISCATLVALMKTQHTKRQLAGGYEIHESQVREKSKSRIVQGIADIERAEADKGHKPAAAFGLESVQRGSVGDGISVDAGVEASDPAAQPASLDAPLSKTETAASTATLGRLAVTRSGRYQTGDVLGDAPAPTDRKPGWGVSQMPAGQPISPGDGEQRRLATDGTRPVPRRPVSGAGMGGAMMPEGMTQDSMMGAKMPPNMAGSMKNGGVFSKGQEGRGIAGFGGRGRGGLKPVDQAGSKAGDGSQALTAPGPADPGSSYHTIVNPPMAGQRGGQAAGQQEEQQNRLLRGELLTGGKGLPQDGSGKAGGGQRMNQNGQVATQGTPQTGESRNDNRAWYFRDTGLATGPQHGLGAPLGYTGFGTLALGEESYPALVENPFRKSTDFPLSTFSIDVDTASYTNVRRFLSSHALPPRDAVRVEELINYFQYSYPQPDGDVPFAMTTDVADCPWNAGHRLLRVGLKGREVPADQRPASNLVFLLDVSGSMDAPNKLPLVKEAMYLLVDKLTENDRVAIVVYAGNSGLVLPPTNGENKAAIRSAISQLVASGSTNGSQGLQMAYDTAQSHFIKGGTNRVILATDGDFNVGIVDQNELVKFIEERAKSGVFLSALGFGIGNLKDGTLEKLADKGNGNYAYIDTLGEARRVLVEQLSGTLVTIAKDVKLQIEFNPAQATEYRLIGYEDRVMPPQDFQDDRKDAGEIGAGHSVTALYEIVPTDRPAEAGEPLKYQRSESLTPAAATGELATIKLRYKQPDGETSRLIEHIVTDRRPPQVQASRDMDFAAAVAAFGMVLRDSPYRGDATYTKVLALAEHGLADDPSGYRSEFIRLVRQAREISGGE